MVLQLDALIVLGLPSGLTDSPTWGAAGQGAPGAELVGFDVGPPPWPPPWETIPLPTQGLFHVYTSFPRQG